MNKWYLVFGYLVGLFFLTSQTVHPVSNSFIHDKLAHGIAYLGLGFLIGRAVGRGVLVAVLLTALYGLSEELHQLLLPGRLCEWKDWLADLVGGVGGVLLFEKLKSWPRLFRIMG